MAIPITNICKLLTRITLYFTWVMLAFSLVLIWFFGEIGGKLGTIYLKCLFSYAALLIALFVFDRIRIREEDSK